MSSVDLTPSLLSIIGTPDSSPSSFDLRALFKELLEIMNALQWSIINSYLKDDNPCNVISVPPATTRINDSVIKGNVTLTILDSKPAICY
ncbi:hypothetical protein CDAR_532471 [Caerostris darwini]|uniref:Uncharacterized protein n=1 Tax=Caerostris darwini TaxID=1538125 RepID=A0AAV4QA05_9ARAC|nr:hypothetical protein CDAR_532471 [Caerostris darwini]